MKNSNKFRLYRNKTLMGRLNQIAATKMARVDALKELSEGRNPIYLLVGHFNGIKEQSRMGGLTHGGKRMSWKFATPPKKQK